MGKRRILVVDDNPDVLRLVDEALTANGYEVTTADCGAEAVRKGELGELASASEGQAQPNLTLGLEATG